MQFPTAHAKKRPISMGTPEMMKARNRETALSPTATVQRFLTGSGHGARIGEGRGLQHSTECVVGKEIAFFDVGGERRKAAVTAQLF